MNKEDMTVYERLQMLCEGKGITVKQMEIDLGMTKGHAFKWNTSQPSTKYIAPLAEYFGVSQKYILTGRDDSGYFIDPETKALAAELRNNKELRAVFDVAKDMPKERLEAFYNLIKNK